LLHENMEANLRRFEDGQCNIYSSMNIANHSK
jgi:hypothetical protein